jgi:phosphoenolpyruvate-protein kinase (PTS system EI component)
MAWKPLASGLFASHPQEVEAPVRVIDGLEAILALMQDEEAQQCVAVTDAAGGSTVSTIIRHVRAIVSTIGGPNSHLVVVARDYNVPCVVGAGELDLGSLSDGTRMRIETSGAVSVWVDD